MVSVRLVMIAVGTLCHWLILVCKQPGLGDPMVDKNGKQVAIEIRLISQHPSCTLQLWADSIPTETSKKVGSSTVRRNKLIPLLSSPCFAQEMVGGPLALSG